jgi:hypothetical protein
VPPPTLLSEASTPPLYYTIRKNQSTVWRENEIVQEHTILIDTMDVRDVDFDLSDAEKRLLYKNGRQAALSYLNRQ